MGMDEEFVIEAQRRIDAIVLEALQRQMDKREELMRGLPTGWTLCCHKATTTKWEDTYTFTETAHVIRPGEVCDYPGQRTQYVRAAD